MNLTSGPSIIIHSGPNGVRIDQRRPNVASVLFGMPATTALARISSLLPICGGAQTLAAQRAIEAARDEQPGEETEAQRGASLWREQAHAAAWRLAIDWPDLIGEPRSLEGMRGLISAGSGADVARALAQFMPGFEAVTEPGDLMDWVAVTDCNAARFLHQVIALDGHAAVPCTGVVRASGDDVAGRARAAFDGHDFDALAPGSEAVEVGAAAMARHPMIPALESLPGLTPVSHRLLAQLLDTHVIAGALQCPSEQLLDPHVIAGALQCPSEQHTGQPQAWTLAAGMGMGCAQTARGPVFHRVTLDARDGETVTDWRVLAPTDWHFSPMGPLARTAANGPRDEPWLRFLVAGFDPCAPWEVVLSTAEDGPDA